jgi:uncharacterized membrane protein
MFEHIEIFFTGFPKEIAVFLMSMIPIGELRISIPIAVFAYHMRAWEAFIISVLGNALPTFIILYSAGKFHLWVEKNAGYMGKHWINILAKAQNSFSKYEKYGLWGLMIFIGSSLPGTGSYTAAFAAFIFGIPFKKSWPYVLAGIAVSGIVTILITVGVDKIF